MSTNSIIEHRANYYFVELREEYLLLCQQTSSKKTKCRATPHCKAFILAILENWTNHKRGQGKHLGVAMTYQQWSDAMYGMFARCTMIDSLEDLIKDGLISRRSCKLFGRETFEYTLNSQELNKRLKALPERSPHRTLPQRDASQMRRVASQNKCDPSQMRRVTDLKRDDDPSQMGRIIESTKKLNIETERETPTVCAKEPALTPPSASFSPSFTPSTSHTEPSSPRRPLERKPEEHQVEQVEATATKKKEHQVPAVRKLEEVSLTEQLADEQIDFWQRWCAKTKCGTSALNEVAYAHIVTLAPRIKTTQDLESLYDLAYERVQELAQAQGKKAIPPHLGNLVKCLPDWEQVQARKQQQQEQHAIKHISGTGSTRNLTEARLRGEVMQPVYYAPVSNRKDVRKPNRFADALPANLRERLVKKL